VTPSALSYQIRQLEDFLQVPLFLRLNRAVKLTEAGQRIAPGVHDAFERLAEAMSRLKGPTPANVLTVSTGPAFAAKWLSPRLHKILER
jgi:LysR family glycine cleavage system transcriptional activator